MFNGCVSNHKGIKMKRLFIALAFTYSASASADFISGDMQLRDAIYLYNQDIRANSQKYLVGENCDVLKLVLDVEAGHTDIGFAESTSVSTALSNKTTYIDRIFGWQAMFAYALYQDEPVKIFALGDRYYPGGNMKTGNGTVFGYCYSTKANARVYFQEKDMCTNRFPDSHTEALPSCTPIAYSSENNNPTQFTSAWLNGKTLYIVYWEEGIPIVGRATFGASTVAYQGIFNDNSTESTGYSVDGGGNLTFGNDPGYEKIVCGGNSQYFRTHYYENGKYADADLFFYNQSDALNYASLMTGDVPPCYVPQ